MPILSTLCCFGLIGVMPLVLANSAPLFTTVNNETRYVLVLRQHAPNMHKLVGHSVLKPQQVFIAKFDFPDRVAPYLIYSLKNAWQTGQCYLKPQRTLEDPNCKGKIKADIVYLGQNSYEFTFYET